MVRTIIKKVERETQVPDVLIREEIEGKPFYYKGYKAVLNKEKILADIIGSSGLQSFIVELLFRFLIIHLPRKDYRIFTNEVGGHIKKGTNLSFDIAVFDRKTLPLDKITPYYTNVPPKIVFEIDVKIDVEKEDAIAYMTTKTETLLNYGTELVIWVLTNPKTLLVARPNSEWAFIKWDKDVVLMDEIILNIANLIKEEEELG